MTERRRFRAVTFDCYGTLVDWETGIGATVAELLTRRGITRPTDAVLESFARREAEIEARTPIVPYHALLREAIASVGRDLGVDFDARDTLAFADSIGRWPLFADVLPALQRLRESMVVAILSNVDWRSFRNTEPAFAGSVEIFCLAEDIGAYKPSPVAFAALLARLADRGIAATEVLHVAQSLFHDHAPASQLGIATCLLDRRHGQPGHGAVIPPVGQVDTDYRIVSLTELLPLVGIPAPAS
jgi:2-haloalkanoic acid dehalogenase type II